MNKIIKIFFSLVLNIFLFSTISFAQDWVAPEAENAKVNPVEMNIENADLGSVIYKKNCQSCHGEPGLGNYLPLVPPPIDVASEKMQKNSDGAVFYKITTGKGGMPSFATMLSDDDRWKLVTFIKSFSADLKTDDVDKLKDVTIVLSYDTTNYVITATVTGKNAASEVVPLVGEKINFGVKRYFGELLLNEIGLKTNNQGVATATFQKDLPADTLGNVNIIVSLDSKKYKDISVTEQVKWGVPTVVEDFYCQSAMWGNRQMAPWWIVALYLGIAGGAWLTILYVVTLILKIKKLGKVK